MGVEIIATNVITIVTPLVIKGADAATATLGKSLFGQTNGLLRLVKSELNGDREAENTVESFELNPTRYKVSLQEILAEELRENEELAKEFEMLINDMGPLDEVVKKIGSLGGEAITLDTANTNQSAPANTNQSAPATKGDVKAAKRGVHATAVNKQAAEPESKIGDSTSNPNPYPLSESQPNEPPSEGTASI